MMTTIEHEIFDSMREDFNEAINTLFLVMADKKSDEGKLSLTMNVMLAPKDYTDPDTGEYQQIKVPMIEHKIKISVKNEGTRHGVSCGEYSIVFTPDGAVLETIRSGQINMFEGD